ncbi:MAG: preprotein translocase subunit SecE [Parachlamydiales bacterium]|nr:preprotein translocase subunit SecE [Parachlamydiales bacterium]
MASQSKLVDYSEKKKKLNYFRQVQAELKKVSWTSKSELVVYTKIVLLSTLIFALSIYIADLGVRSVLNFINIIARFIIG